MSEQITPHENITGGWWIVNINKTIYGLWYIWRFPEGEKWRYDEEYSGSDYPSYVLDLKNLEDVDYYVEFLLGPYTAEEIMVAMNNRKTIDY